jgi:glyoxylase-like metal-dependent hydrolase (beta-lactamase superfamily II)
MHRRVVGLSLAVLTASAFAVSLAGQGNAPERQLVARAAEALGGRDRLMAMKTLQIVGYGELAYFNGGGNITGDPDAPQKWQKVLEYTRTIDLEHWRTRVQQRLKMDFVFASTVGQLGLNRTNETLDGDVAYNIGGGFLAAPQSAAPPQGAAGGGNTTPKPVKVADHVWYLNGNTVFEFDDHLTMVEANRTDAALQAILDLANALVPGKRVTQVIQSHHHFDHSVGLRAAVAQGLTIISRRGNEGIFREMVARPARMFPDALGRSPKALKFIPVDDHLKLKDSTNEIDIYHIVGNYHMADGVIVHVPASNLLVEADLTTQNWDFNWWGDSLMNNIEYRKIKVDTNMAVHAQQPYPLAEVVAAIETQVRNTQAFCRRAAEAQFFQPGCPIQYNRPLPQK